MEGFCLTAESQDGDGYISLAEFIGEGERRKQQVLAFNKLSCGP
jgi:hypothetical protein